jgi:hypothetical protein
MVAIQTTKPPRRRSLSRRVSGGRRDRSPPPSPLSRGRGPITRNRGLGQEAGGHLVGKAMEAVVDLGFDLSEVGGVLVQSVEQPLLHVIDLIGQRCRDISQRRDERAGLGLVADLHVRLAGEGEQTARRQCYRDPQFIATFSESARHSSPTPTADASLTLRGAARAARIQGSRGERPAFRPRPRR